MISDRKGSFSLKINRETKRKINMIERHHISNFKKIIREKFSKELDLFIDGLEV